MSQRKLYQRWLHPLPQVDDLGLEVESELQFHLEMRAQENMRAGMSAEVAWQDAKRRFGDLRKIKAACVKIRSGGPIIRTFLAWNHRLCHPTLSILAMVTLMAGIGVVIYFCRVIAETSHLPWFLESSSDGATSRSLMTAWIPEWLPKGVSELWVIAGWVFVFVACATFIACLNVASLRKARAKRALQCRPATSGLRDG